MSEDLWLFLLAGAAGGAVNAAAGGAKLFVFPLLLAAGLPPLMANATGTIALWPAQLSAVFAYRHLLIDDVGSLIRRMLPALLGAACGAMALIVSSDELFTAVIPFFLILAVTTIAFGTRTATLVRRVVPAVRVGMFSALLLFVTGFYGGFFGAGLGFLIVAVLLSTATGAINQANAEKNLFALSINTTAVVPLSLSGLVDWKAAAGVILGGLVGGYFGAALAQKLPETLLRLTVAGLGFALTLRFLFANG